MSIFPFDNPQVEAVFAAYPPAVRDDLLRLRALILDTAHTIAGVGEIIETLKWGQPAYLPAKPRVGTTVRIGALKAPKSGTAVFVHCQSRLADRFRETYPDVFTFEGNRALTFEPGADLPENALRHCIAMAFTWHLKVKI